MKILYSKSAALQLAISPRKLTGSFTIARGFDTNRRGPVQKGERAFDWENALVFAINDEEADQILEEIKVKDSVELRHFPQDGQSKATSYLSIHKRDQSRITIVITKVSGPDKLTLSYTTLNRWQTRSIMRFLMFVRDLPQHQELAKVIAFNWPSQ